MVFELIDDCNGSKLTFEALRLCGQSVLGVWIATKNLESLRGSVKTLGSLQSPFEKTLQVFKRLRSDQILTQFYLQV
jgi:hypothetical protein